MPNFLRSLLGSKSYPLNKIYLSKQQLIDNYTYLSALQKRVQVAPVLKSNAYGHGIAQVAQILQGEALDKIPFICVDSLYEAYQLLDAGVKDQILIMGYVDPRSLEGKKLPFAYAVITQQQLIEIRKRQPDAVFHLFVDTGMNREGIQMLQLLEFAKFIKQNNIQIEGLMSHLSMPAKDSSTQTKLQLNNFRAAKLMLKQEGVDVKWFHLGGTYSLIKRLTEECNVIRCGKGLYGFGESKLKPVLSMTSTIIQWKNLKKGDNVGYDATFTAPKEMAIAVLPIGYNDGVDRRLSNKGVVRVVRATPEYPDRVGPKQEYPIVGRVSMNLTVVDVTKAIHGINVAYDGAEIEVISDDPTSPNSVQNIAKLCDSIPEEILVHLHPSTRREII